MWIHVILCCLLLSGCQELRSATGSSEVHGIDNAFRGQLDALRDAVLQEMQHDFDEFVRSHDSKFTATRTNSRKEK